LIPDYLFWLYSEVLYSFLSSVVLTSYVIVTAVSLVKRHWTTQRQHRGQLLITQANMHRAVNEYSDMTVSPYTHALLLVHLPNDYRISIYLNNAPKSRGITNHPGIIDFDCFRVLM
jgi:hypothetical protein